MTKRLALLIALLCIAVGSVTVPATSQVTDPTGVLASDNVEILTSLPNPGVIGARFKGDHMYVTSVAGLTVYDVATNPQAPAQVGVLPLPHFENEDVDLGG
ncbi:MAG TPA: hypothetical protein VFS18_02770, partial [Actinomycetota bacterium]|nr:hypothetical protein [Actinomycetota bacterium]